MGKIVAVILAGGKGKRMESDVSKQFIEIQGKPLIYYTLKSFEKCLNIDEVLVVLPKNEIEYFKKEILNKFELKVDKIIEGGLERQDSVYNALNKINDCDIVLIHDGARPFVNLDMINSGIAYAKEFGAAAPGVMPKDTIKIKNDNNFSIETPNRNLLVAVQTPQCFKYDIISKCHERIKKDFIAVTDDTMAVEMFGNKVFLYEGDYKNIKVTTPEDLILCNEFIKAFNH